jgi:L-amino acid N-acyltransferase
MIACSLLSMRIRWWVWPHMAHFGTLPSGLAIGSPVENTIHVREDCWGRGVGKALMRELIESARERGKHSIIAAVDSANEKSIRLHERLGFVEVARMLQVGAKFGEWLDLVLLELLLDDRSSPDKE